MRVLFELTAALFRSYWNELTLDEKDRGTKDPVKFRFGAFPSDGTNYLGSITADVLSGDTNNPHRREVLIIALKWRPVPSIEFHLQRTSESGSDSDMVKVATFTASGIHFHVPTNMGGGTMNGTIALRSRANGKLVCAEGGGSQALIANRDGVGDWELFDVINR